MKTRVIVVAIALGLLLTAVAAVLLLVSSYVTGCSGNPCLPHQ